MHKSVFIICFNQILNKEIFDQILLT